MSIKILLVEDHELTRKGIAYSLKTFPDIEIIGDVDNGKKAVDFISSKKPDVILMDIAMPVMNGIDATKKINESYPDIKIIMLTSINEKQSVLSAFHSGANAYCMKDIKSEELINIIKAVMTGAVWIDPNIARYVLDILQTTGIPAENKTPNNIFNLTAREKEILKLIAEGRSNKDIAEKLVLSLHTVKNHVKNIIQKLAVDDRTQAAILALKENLI
ncbi:MAG TPA: response regulator transcription factor [Candidatus Adamsella sp.]|nr:response regulator transcription factor [Candidatus Adamsella sp.]